MRLVTSKSSAKRRQAPGGSKSTVSSAHDSAGRAFSLTRDAAEAFFEADVTGEQRLDFDEFLSWLWLTLRVRFAHRNEGFARRVNDWLLTLDAPPPPAMPEPETPTAKGKGKKK